MTRSPRKRGQSAAAGDQVPADRLPIHGETVWLFYPRNRWALATYDGERSAFDPTEPARTPILLPIGWARSKQGHVNSIAAARSHQSLTKSQALRELRKLWPARVSKTVTVEQLIREARAGDPYSACDVLVLIAGILKHGHSVSGAGKDYLHERMEAVFEAFVASPAKKKADAIARALLLTGAESGRKKIHNAARDADIVDATIFLHERGGALSVRPGSQSKWSAFVAVSEWLSERGVSLGSDAIKKIWENMRHDS